MYSVKLCSRQLITVASISVLILAGTALAESSPGDSGALPAYLRDRGSGTPTSIFGTYVREGELLVYPFYEYYHDVNAEYAPNDFGFALDQDFRGKYYASEGLIFLGYGLTSNLALELEAAIIDATLQTSGQDPTTISDEIEENGLGDVQTQIDWLWSRETTSRPAFFSYVEVNYPFSKGKDLIGTSDWEYKAGTGLIRGFGWGTVTVRAAGEYVAAEKNFALGEMAVEYLKRVSPTWRLYAGVEANQDEAEFITEAQWRVARNAVFKFNNAFGITSKATDWAPEIGLMFSVPTK